MERFANIRKVLLFLAAACCFNSCLSNHPYPNVKEVVQVVLPVPPLVDTLLQEGKKEIRRAKAEARTRKLLLNSAKRWLHVRELTGNNDHPWITRAMAICGLNGDEGHAWCAACQAEIFDHVNIPAPNSARVVKWFEQNVIWQKGWGKFPFKMQPGMEVGFWNNRLKRPAHIGFGLGEDFNNYYLLEGNTSKKGAFDPETLCKIENPDHEIVREAGVGGGFYPKIRSKSSIYIIADYGVSTSRFVELYHEYLKVIFNKKQLK